MSKELENDREKTRMNPLQGHWLKDRGGVSPANVKWSCACCGESLPRELRIGIYHLEEWKRFDRNR
jgi:hypothetical protein